MRTALFIVFTIWCLFTKSGALAASSEQFQLQTHDGLTKISGQIDFPEKREGLLPIVIMVPGTGLFDRDAEFGKTGTEGDLIFKKISEKLAEAGFAVLRYDYRGVSCNSQSMPRCPDCSDHRARKKAMFGACVDNKIRASVTPGNIRDDIELLFEYAKDHPRVRPDQIVAFGHSEGSLNLSYLIEQERIQPKGVVFMGGVAESPKSVIKWQVVGRATDLLLKMDIDRDGIVTNAEIEDSHGESPLSGHPLEQLLSPVGQWTKETFQANLEKGYNVARDEAMSHDDNEAFGFGGVVQASYRWWKMWFTDDRSVAENLLKYPGQVTYVHGATDFQVDCQKQKDVLQSFLDKFTVHPKMVIIEGVGHTLGDDPVIGPINESSIMKLVEAAESAVK